MENTTIYNLTQHTATAKQAAVGVVDLYPEDRIDLARLLTFDTLPTPDQIRQRAEAITTLAKSYCAEVVMIGGAPYLMGPLEKALREAGIVPLYAFSVRESVDAVQEDGTVRKTSVFKHAGFVEGALHV